MTLKWRGCASKEWALVGEDDHGITVHFCFFVAHLFCVRMRELYSPRAETRVLLCSKNVGPDSLGIQKALGDFYLGRE